jgi:hypothetical protein
VTKPKTGDREIFDTQFDPSKVGEMYVIERRGDLQIIGFGWWCRPSGKGAQIELENRRNIQRSLRSG